MLAEHTDVQIYIANPYSPRQRGSNEDTNGLPCQYISKGSGLSIYQQEEFDAIELSSALNIRTGKHWDGKLRLPFIANT